jgi:hypothetical protein
MSRFVPHGFEKNPEIKASVFLAFSIAYCFGFVSDFNANSCFFDVNGILSKLLFCCMKADGFAW